MSNPKVVEKKIAELRPYDDNPRIYTEGSMADLSESLRLYGQQEPIIIDAGNVIVCGAAIVECMKRLGMETAFCSVCELSPEEIGAYRLVDNLTGTLSRWDSQKYEGELSALGVSLQGFSFGIKPIEMDGPAPVAIDEPKPLETTPNPRADNDEPVWRDDHTHESGTRFVPQGTPESRSASVKEYFHHSPTNEGIAKN